MNENIGNVESDLNMICHKQKHSDSTNFVPFAYCIQISDGRILILIPYTKKKTNTDPNCIRPLCTHTHKHTELRKICFFFVFRSVPFYINESYKKYWKSTNTIFKKLIWDLIINSSSPCFVFIMCVFFYSLIQSIQKIRF